MDRKLASVQKVLKIETIDGADAIDKATVLGWQCVVKKNEFKEGDLAVYMEIDSFLPIIPEFEFLRKGCYKRLVDGNEGFRLKTIKLRGTLSQGLLLPIHTFNDRIVEPHEGDDVTEVLNIVKYEPPIPAQLRGLIKGNFPSFVPKTDEIRIQSCPGVLEEIRDLDCYITEKVDGTSLTVFVKGGEFGVCSRKLELKEDENNTYWKMTKKYDIIQKLVDWSSEKGGKDFAVQCEIIGPGIQKNKLGLKECEIRVFNLYNITDVCYEDYMSLKVFCDTTGLPMVKVLEETVLDIDTTIDKLLERAKGSYDCGYPREGIVIRPIKEAYSNELKGRLSFKAINNDFLLKEKE